MKDLGIFSIVSALCAVWGLTVAEGRAATLDQEQAETGGWALLQRDWDRCLLAQTITPSVSGRLIRVSLSGMYIALGPEFPTTFSIFDTAGERPGTNLLGRAILSQLANSGSVEFVNPPVYLVAGRQYAIVIGTEDPVVGGMSYGFRCGLYNPYPGGRTWQRVGEGPWVDVAYPTAACDLVFATYMEPGLPAVRLSTPIEGSIVRAGESVAVTALASELASPPFTLAVLADGQLVGTSASSPFQANWRPSVGGESELIATLTSTPGVTFTSAPVHVRVVSSAPPNDRFVDRLLLTNGYHVLQASNGGATLDPGEAALSPPGVGASVWWSWTAPRAGEVVVAAESPQDTNSILGIFTGTAVDGLMAITGGVGQCVFTATAGTTYQIALDSVAGYLTNATLVVALNDVAISTPSPGAVFHAPVMVTVQAQRAGAERQLAGTQLEVNGVSAGQVPLDTLRLSCVFPSPGGYNLRLATVDDRAIVTHSDTVPVHVRPANDDFEAAQTLDGRLLAIHASNAEGTMQVSGLLPWETKTGEPTWAQNQGGHSIWYRWTAPNDGLCEIDGAGAGFALLFNVCLGNTVNSLAVVAANAMAPPPGIVSFDAVAGTTYFISVDGFFGEEGELDWTLHLAPYNDRFSDRRLLAGISAEFQDSNLGATIEAGEAALAAAGAGSSLWFTWQAPLSGDAVITVTGTHALMLEVFLGESLATLVPVATNAEGWVLSPRVTFRAEAGRTYQIGVFGQGADKGSFLFQLGLLGLHLVSPLPNSILSAPATLSLAAQLGVPGKALREVTYSVNGSAIGTVTNPPYALDWPAPGAGSYTLTACGVATDGASFDSRPVVCLVHAGAHLPRPRVFSGVSADASYVVNAVGALYLFGGGGAQFGRPETNSPSTPFLGAWPAGVTGWREISGGWAISDAGELYQNGQVRIPFPPGVTEWKQVSCGVEGVAALGNDGDIYLSGSQRLAVAQPPGGWRELGTSLASVNNAILALGGDNEAYVISYGNYQWNVSLLPRPAGVSGWKSIAQAALFGVLLTDDRQLYIYGMYGGITGTSDTPGWSLVPRPSGVNHWTDFTAGGFHVLAIGDNGQLYAWGRNWEHQLGIGQDQNPRATPVLVSPPSGVGGWSAVAGGWFHSLAIGHDCSVYAWGDNGTGQAGQPISPPLSRPFRVGSLEALCGTPVLFTDGNASRLPDGRFRLQFNTDLNRSYLVQYSDDLQTWKNSTPAITGTGGLVEWIDDGPPKTEQHPASVPYRTYRVVYAP